MRLAFCLPAEPAHNLVLAALAAAQRTPPALSLLRRRYRNRIPAQTVALGQELLGLRFENPVGLAAGFDKNARVASAMAALGFGWLEVGTVTPRPQRGNPKPRLFRHVAGRTLENALGFNNQGTGAVRRRLERLRRRRTPLPPLGVNVGKNKTTPNEGAVEDYAGQIEALNGLADYFVVNVSSPNTPGLRALQSGQTLVEIVGACRERTSSPILVKLAPDLEDSELVGLAETAIEAGAAGVTLTNTTVDHAATPGSHGKGGLSGEALKERSFSALQTVAKSLQDQGLLVSVGGIDSGAEVYRRVRAGAALVQLYSALVFAGPRLVVTVLDELATLLASDGLERLSDAVGVDL